MFLEDVAGADHHPGGLDPVEGSALLLLHQDLVGGTQEVSKGNAGASLKHQAWVFSY